MKHLFLLIRNTYTNIGHAFSFTCFIDTSAGFGFVNFRMTAHAYSGPIVIPS